MGTLAAGIKDIFSTAKTTGTNVMLCGNDGTPDGHMSMKNLTSNLIPDGAKVGIGYGVCSTDAGTTAKVTTIINFVLLKNVPVYILFTKAVDAPNATLNISSTGAKPIFYLGTAIQPSVIRPNTVVTFVYDGTNYNIVAIAGLEESASSSGLWVDMGLPSGLKWAIRNIDVTQANGFAASEYQYECSFFSWGNTDGHNPISASAFEFNWGSGNDTEPYVSSSGAKLTSNIAPSFDAARINCGAPWRLPTTGEFKELFDNCDFVDENGNAIAAATTDKRITMNSIVGIRLKSKFNGKYLFFPCSGLGTGTSLSNRGANGYYWSSSLHSATNGRYLLFYSGGVNPQYNDNRFYGFTVRPVQ